MTYKRIRELREDHDLTQKYMAHYLNVIQRTYSRYERGERIIPPDVLCKIADFYKCRLSAGTHRYKAALSSLTALQKNKRHLAHCARCLLFSVSDYFFLYENKFPAAHRMVPAAIHTSDRLNTILRISFFFTFRLT